MTSVDSPNSPDPGRLDGVRILHVSPPLAPDIRSDKENASYRAAGATVGMAVVGVHGDLHSAYDDPLTTLISLPLTRSGALRAKIGLQAKLDSAVIRNQVRRAISLFGPDVLHVHNMFIARAVQECAPNIPILLDLHENDPAACEIYRSAYPPLKRLMFAVFQFRTRLTRREREAIDRSDVVITVTEEATERINTEYHAHNVFTVPNLESHNYGIDRPLPRASTRRPNDPLNIVYVGGFGPHRGLETLARGVGLANKEGIHVTANLYGAQESDYLKKFEKMLHDEGLESFTNLHGWIPKSEVARRIDEADLCTVPHSSNEQTEATLPHKLFQYMARAKPVLVSSCSPLRRHVRKAQAGFVFEADNPISCALEIRSAAESKDLAARGQSGLYYIKSVANWELISEPALIGAVQFALRKH